MSEPRAITRASEAEALAVGSVIAEVGEPDAPAVACKAARGDWQYLGDDPDRRYWSSDMFPPEDQPIRNLRIVVLWEPGWSMQGSTDVDKDNQQ